MRRIAVFGLGYVGAVTAASLADQGHHVVGVDTNAVKVDMMQSRRTPVVEDGLADLIAAGVDAGRLRATASVADAMASSDLSMICVGTPSRPNGSLDLTQVERVCRQIGAHLASADSHIVVVRSTMLPGSSHAVVIPALEQTSGKQQGRDFHVCVNPEFLREGSAIRDFRNPPFTLVGGDNEAAARVVGCVYEQLEAEVVVAPLRVAEMVKYTSNAFHALKVAFANEIGSICRQQGIDSHAVMDIFARDDKLNISKAYLKPGFAFGGSCLPKDLRALVSHARRLDVETPLLESVIPSNNGQVDRAFRLIQDANKKRIGVLGFSFKAGTDDLRESPLVELIERLIGKGYEVRLFDRNVSLAALHGANREYIEREIPHIASLMCDTIGEVLESSDLIVIGNADPEFSKVSRTVDDHQMVLDLVRLDPHPPARTGYMGIGW